MPITKGYLTRNYQPKPASLVGGILLWILSAYILYAFFQLFRESLRLFSGYLGDRVLLVLSTSDNYIYNLFYASIASAVGYAIALRFTIQNPITEHDWRSRSKIRRVLTTEGFHTWTSLYWFAKLGSLLGISYLTFSLQFDLDLIKDAPLLLVLFPLVLFYATWPSFSRLIKTKKMAWFMISSCLFLAMSFGFAFKNFTEYEKINKKTLGHSLEYVFDLKIPRSQSQQRIFRKSLTVDVFIVKDTMETELPVVFFERSTQRVNVDGISEAIRREQNKLSEFERSFLNVNLSIDERLSIQVIKPILEEFRKAGLELVQFTTARKYSNYPSIYPAFQHSGIHKRLNPEYYPELVAFLDSMEQIDLSGKKFKLSESWMYRNGGLKGYNRIEIDVNKESVLLNGQEIDTLVFEQTVYGFIKKYASNYVIIFNTSDEITYGRYIEYLDVIYTQVDRLRNEHSLKLYNRPYDDFEDWEDESYSIRGMYPKNILEWSSEELRLNELIKKSSK
jgi:hypothetical protein